MKRNQFHMNTFFRNKKLSEAGNPITTSITFFSLIYSALFRIDNQNELEHKLSMFHSIFIAIDPC